MEGPELSGPSVWVELNKKNGDKIVAFITKNQVRNINQLNDLEKELPLLEPTSRSGQHGWLNTSPSAREKWERLARSQLLCPR